MEASEEWFIFNPTTSESGYNTIQPRPANIKLTRVPIFDKIAENYDALDEKYQNKFDSLGKRNKEQANAIDRFKKANSGYRIESFYEDDETHKVLNKMFRTADDAGVPSEDLGWAYKCFQVEKDTTTTPLQSGKPHRILQDYIYLFNVVVAFEWEPGPTNLAVIEAAARRASDFLFDVTDGWMAFGQVVIGGPKLMDCADIQILASNRLNPRAWVGALHEWAKYMPIRLGRGLWQKNNRISIPWDEPEGYRTVVHEWAHYALELRDSYTETHQVYLPGDTKASQSPNEARRSNRDLVVASISQPVESIMSRLEGTSELVPHENDHPALRKQKEWDQIVDGDPRYGKRFPRIAFPFEQLEGPLPLRDLPHVVQLVTGQTPTLTGQTTDQTSLLGGMEVLLPDIAIDDDIEREHCWVYVLKNVENDIPARIIAQGTIEVYQEGGMRLFGTNKGDEIVLIGNGIDWRERVRSHKITAASLEPIEQPGKHTHDPRKHTPDPPYQEERRQLIDKVIWEDTTPDPFPVIDVVPEDVEYKTDIAVDRTTKVRVYVYSQLETQNGKIELKPDKEAQIYIFPLDQVNYPGPSGRSWLQIDWGDVTTQPISLDGHILVRWKDKNEQVIVTFSQGGGPHTGSPTGPPPLTAGSSEGNLMIFFGDRQEDLIDLDRGKKYARLRIVTTRMVGAPTRAEYDAQPRSYAFSLGGNGPLPPTYKPTLLLAYDKRSELEDGTAEIYRFDESAGLWRSIPSYRPRGAWYVAAPLDSTTAPRLFATNLKSEEQRVERFRLHWVPRAAAENKAAGTADNKTTGS